MTEYSKTPSYDWFKDLKLLTDNIQIVTKKRNGPQCASLIKVVGRAFGYNGPQWGWGRGVADWPKTMPSEFKQMLDTLAVDDPDIPEGSIIVFGKSINGPKPKGEDKRTGHIALFDGWADDDRVHCWGQNAGGRQPGVNKGCYSHTIRRKHIISVYKIKDIHTTNFKSLSDALTTWNYTDGLKQNPILPEPDPVVITGDMVSVKYPKIVPVPDIQPSKPEPKDPGKETAKEVGRWGWSAGVAALLVVPLDHVLGGWLGIEISPGGWLNLEMTATLAAILRVIDKFLYNRTKGNLSIPKILRWLKVPF